MDWLALNGYVRSVWREPTRLMGHGYLGPWVTFGSADTTQALVPDVWVKTVVTVADTIDIARVYSETIVEKGQTDRSKKL